MDSDKIYRFTKDTTGDLLPTDSMDILDTGGAVSSATGDSTGNYVVGADFRFWGQRKVEAHIPKTWQTNGRNSRPF